MRILGVDLNIYERLAQSWCHRIFGHDDVKKEFFCNWYVDCRDLTKNLS